MTNPNLRHLFSFVFLIVAAFFVIVSYNRHLPVAELDEGILLSQTIRDRGLNSFDVFTVSGYPPVILILFTITQLITESILQEPVLNHAGLVINIVRIMAIFANLITVILIYQIGKKVGYPLVGLVSACLWATLPLVNNQASQALTEPWQILFITASAWAMFKSMETLEAKWLILCTILGLFTVLSKYNTFPVLGFGVGTTLWFLISKARKLLWGSILAIQLSLILATAYGLLYIYGAQELLTVGRPEAARFVNSGLQTLSNPASILYIFSVASVQMGFPNLVLLMAVFLPGLVLMFYRSELNKQIPIAFMLIFLFVFIWMVPSYLVYDVLKYRYISPSSSIFVLLIGLSIWHLVDVIAQKLKRDNAIAYIFLAIVTLWFLPNAWMRLIEFSQLQHPQAGQLATTWSKISLEPGASLAITGLEGSTMRWRYFNNVWGGYIGPSRPLVDILLYLQKPKMAWIDAGIDYVHLTGNYPGDFPLLPFERDEMLLLKAFESQNLGDNWFNASWYIYRLERYENSVDLRFSNSIRLIGYDISQVEGMLGDSIDLRLFWQANLPPEIDYQVYIHLSDLDEHTVLAQVDGTPGLPTRLTSTWTDPEEILVSPSYQLTIPEGLEAGEYRLMIGLYNATTGERLLTDIGQDSFELSRLIIEQ